MKIKLILYVIGVILLFGISSTCQTTEFKKSSIPYSTQDTFYLNRAGALRVLKMQVDYLYCQQAGSVKDSIITTGNNYIRSSQQKISILQTRVTELEAQTGRHRKVILRQRISGVGLVAVLVLSVLSH